MGLFGEGGCEKTGVGFLGEITGKFIRGTRHKIQRRQMSKGFVRNRSSNELLPSLAYSTFPSFCLPSLQFLTGERQSPGIAF